MATPKNFGAVWASPPGPRKALRFSSRTKQSPRPLPNQERTDPLRYRVSVASIQQPTEASKSPAVAAEAVRVQRLRDDARRPMSINLAEGIALSHKLMQFVGTARPH